VAFQAPYISDYVTKFCWQQAEVMSNHENANVGDIGEAKRDTENIRAAVKRTIVVT
jgi:hypothetical protein